MKRFAVCMVAVAALMLPYRGADAAPARAQDTRPRNIIFVLVDDLRFNSMGFLNPKINTPNIDRLAGNGMYFPNALVTSSLCSPSRATILTGMTTRNHRIVDNTNSSEEGLTFFPSYLQDAGYETAFVGKWHMGDETDAPRPGFDKWVSFKGQGAYFPTDFLSPEAVANGERQMLNVDGRAIQQTGYITDELTDYAMNWLEEERDADKPFFLYLSHKAVHSDAIPAPRHEGQYDDVTFDLPESAADTPANREGKPMWVQNQRNSWHGIDFFYAKDQPMTDYLRDYYGALSAVDESLGRIMAWLEENDLEDDTMVVFYSDNGYMIGDHGLIDKRNAYEGSIRVPMLVYAPGLVPEGETNPARVRNLDLAPTFLDVAGVPAPEQFEGVSVLPLATGEIAAEAWEAPDFIYEYYWEWTFPQTPTTFAIKRDRMKYIQYHGVWDIEELYDLETDPREMHNLIDDPAYREEKIMLRRALFKQLADEEGLHNIPYSERQAEGVVQRDEDGPKAAPFPEKWLVAPNRADRLDGLFPERLEKETAGE